MWLPWHWIFVQYGALGKRTYGCLWVLHHFALVITLRIFANVNVLQGVCFTVAAIEQN